MRTASATRIFRALQAALVAALAFGFAVDGRAASEKPNILVIIADDVGIINISTYSREMEPAAGGVRLKGVVCAQDARRNHTTTSLHAG